jgi:hypothetical protein
MVRRPTVAGAATCLLVVLLVVAAASGPARLWTVTTTSGATPPAAAPATSAADPTDGTADEDDPSTGGSFEWLQVVSITLFAVVAVVGIASIRRTHWLDRLRRVVERGRWNGSPLPEIGEPGRLVIDAGAARAALRSGTPRNAIVACWQRLEHDAADTGFERYASETSAEYVERVVASTSIDPGPIDDLAALYREARFSSHTLDDRHRERAVETLEQVVAALYTAPAAPR